MTSTESALPHVQVVRGTPDDVELAALVAGLVAAADREEDDGEPGTPRAAWSDRSRTMPGAGAGWRTGADAWRRSLR